MYVSKKPSKTNSLMVTEVAIKMVDGQYRFETSLKYLLAVADKSCRVEKLLGECFANSTYFSQKTHEKLQDLVDSIEADLAPRHFEP